MSDLGNLLQMIYDLLTGWLNSFTSHAAEVMEKLNLIEEDTDTIVSNTSDIADDTNDIKDNTGAIITPVQSIKTNTDSIKTDTTTIKNNVSTMSNQLGTISTNVGTASAFTEDVANNTLDIKDKVVTIASDTTQIRSNTNTVVTDMSKVYEALKWALVDKITTETEEGDNSVSFDTDLTNDLVSLEVGIEATQTGSGTPSPDNVRPIVGVTNKSITVNGNNVTIALGQTVYGGVLDVINGILKITHSKITCTGASSEVWNDYPAGNGFFISGINSHKSESYGDGLCNILPTSYRLTDMGAVFGINSRYIFLMQVKTPWNISTVSDLRTFLSNNNLELLFTLETPITVTLTPSQIATIKGINTIITDGNISVTYEESVKHYLDKQEA